MWADPDGHSRWLSRGRMLCLLGAWLVSCGCRQQWWLYLSIGFVVGVPWVVESSRSGLSRRKSLEFRLCLSPWWISSLLALVRQCSSRILCNVGYNSKTSWVLCRLVDDLALVVCLLRDDYCVGVFLPYLQLTGQHGVHLSCGYIACSLFFSLPSWEICTVSIGVSSADQLSRTCAVCAPQLVHCIFSCSCCRLSLCFCYSEVPPIQWDRSYCWVLVVAFWSIDTFFWLQLWHGLPLFPSGGSVSQHKMAAASLVKARFVDYMRKKMVLYRICEILLNFPRSWVVVPVDVPKIEITGE